MIVFHTDYFFSCIINLRAWIRHYLWRGVPNRFDLLMLARTDNMKTRNAKTKLRTRGIWFDTWKSYMLLGIWIVFKLCYFLMEQKNDKCSGKHLFQTTDIVRSFLIHQVKLHQIQVNTFIKVSTSSSIPPSNGAARRKINLFLFQFVSMSWTNLNRFLPADHDDKAKSVVVNFNKITINFSEMTRKRPYFTRKWEV